MLKIIKMSPGANNKELVKFKRRIYCLHVYLAIRLRQRASRRASNASGEREKRNAIEILYGH